MALSGLPPFTMKLPTEIVILGFSSLADAPAVKDSGLVGALVLPGPVRVTLLDGVPARDGEPLVVAFLFFSGKGWDTRRLRSGGGKVWLGLGVVGGDERSRLVRGEQVTFN